MLKKKKLTLKEKISLRSGKGGKKKKRSGKGKPQIVSRTIASTNSPTGRCYSLKAYTNHQQPYLSVLGTCFTVLVPRVIFSWNVCIPAKQISPKPILHFYD